jgi:hypothetical protein
LRCYHNQIGEHQIFEQAPQVSAGSKGTCPPYVLLPPELLRQACRGL